MFFIKITTVIILSIFISSCTRESEKVFPRNDWLSSSANMQGVSNIQMHSALKVLADYCGPDSLYETIIIKNGYVIYEGDSTHKSHNIYSCSKSFTSTALGLLIEDGKCNLDDLAYLVDPILKEHYNEVTLRHFTTMTSGYNAVGTSRWCEDCGEDWSPTPFQPDEPLFEAGTEYAYWDEAQMFLGRLLLQIADEDIKEYLDRKVMKKIDFGEWDWWYEEELNGIPLRNGCTGVTINAKQLARMGYLFLNNGNWNGEQIIPQNWVKEATSVQVDENIPVADTDRKSTKGNGRYGFNWWIRGDVGDMDDTPKGTYYMSGLNNNMCFVIPEWDMVFIRMGDDYNPEEGKRFVYNQFFKSLSKAIIK